MLVLILREFENYATGALDIIYNNSHILISYCVLLREVVFYNIDCLQMAMVCDCKQFVSQPVVQQLFDSIWWGQMKYHNLERARITVKVIY